MRASDVVRIFESYDAEVVFPDAAGIVIEV